MKRRTSIHYFIAHMKIRNLIFEEWQKTNELLNQGPEALKQCFCELWNDLKEEFKNREDLEITDMERQIEPDDFEISYSVLDNNIKAFTFVMPKSLTDFAQAECVTLVITPKIPRYFTFELSEKIDSQKCYVIGEWQIDFENNDYKHKNYGSIEELNIGKYLGRINKILRAEN